MTNITKMNDKLFDELGMTPLSELNVNIQKPTLTECAFIFVKALVQAYDTNNEAQKSALLESIDSEFAEFICVGDLVTYLDRLKVERV